jgi:hypothetical protein
MSGGTEPRRFQDSTGQASRGPLVAVADFMAKELAGEVVGLGANAAAKASDASSHFVPLPFETG